LLHTSDSLFYSQTPFVRQNTPHPKELKAKAHKLFGKGKTPDGKAATDQLVSELL
jgi:protein scribble